LSNVPTNLIPTKITGLPEYTGSSTLGYMAYVLEGRTYKVQFATIAAVGAVPSTREINTGTGLGGGGDLSANRTLYILPEGVDDSRLTTTGVAARTYGDASSVPIITVNEQGRITAATTASISLSNYVPTSRIISTGAGLLGGGDLSANLTLSVIFSSTTPEPLGAGSSGVSNVAAREDHVHPAVDLSDTTETQGVLPLSRGGTGNSLSPVVGAVAYSSNDKLYLTPTSGSAGQVLTSDGGAGAPYWQTLSTGGTVTSVNLTAGTGISVSGGPITTSGSITVVNTAPDQIVSLTGAGGTSITGTYPNFTITSSAASGTVTSVSGSGTVNGLTLTGTVTTSGSLTLGGTLSGVSLTSQVSGTLPIANGGTNATTAGAARTSLGAAASGANTDITSIALTSGTVLNAPTSGTDLVNKTYVDSISAGINFHQAVRLASVAALPAYTYNNGSSGVGATITANANGALSLDGVAAASGNRVMIKNEVGGNQAYNGVYDVTQTGSGAAPFILTRSSDFNTAGSGVNQIDAGDFFLVTAGSTQANTSWVQQTALPITVGVTALVFIEFGAATTYSAGTGLTLAGTVFSITNTGVTASTYGSASSVSVVAINAQGQVTSASSTAIAIAASQITSGTLGVARGGTGQTSYTDGQLLIGNSTGNTLSKATLTAGSGITISNGAGTITIASTAGGGTVTSVDGSGGTTGLTLTGGPITTSGTLTLGGTLTVANGGTGATTLTGYVKGTGTAALTASASIPTSDISGGAALTEVDDTNVTLTLGGSPTTALLAATSITAGWTGQLAVSRGGTGASTLTGIVVGNGTSAFTTVTAPSGAIVGTTDTQTLTNKRVTPRMNSQSSTTSPWAWNSDSYDIQAFTALANALTINADAGTPTDGQRTVLRFKDNGTARALTWTTGSTKAFRAVGVTLPTTTVVGKTVYVGCLYNSFDSRWDAVAVSQEA
jgi:hypothetical protein